MASVRIPIWDIEVDRICTKVREFDYEEKVIAELDRINKVALRYPKLDGDIVELLLGYKEVLESNLDRGIEV